MWSLILRLCFIMYCSHCNWYLKKALVNINCESIVYLYIWAASSICETTKERNLCKKSQQCAQIQQYSKFPVLSEQIWIYKIIYEQNSLSYMSCITTQFQSFALILDITLLTCFYFYCSYGLLGGNICDEVDSWNTHENSLTLD